MSIAFSLGLALLAGLSTTIGSLFAFLIKKKNPKFSYLCVAFGFSAGVMIFVSFTELLAYGIRATNMLTAIIGFFGGILLIYLVDVSIPHIYEEEKHGMGKLKRTALMIALGIAIHNFPEGIAVMFSSITDARLGILIALAVALHNIPEGIAVALPIFYSTKSRKKAFWYSFLSGIAEPIGAILGFLFLYQFLNEFILGIILSAVAGIMVFISFDEMLPFVYKHKESNEHLSLLGMFLGMFMIALSMIVL
ncbi:MAG: zinc transporter ZupT [Candidatus Aenigmatarchaeota archaeon]